MTKIKEEHSFQRVRLMKQAAAIRQNNGMNRHDALVTAHRIGALIRQKCPLPLHQTRRQRPPRHRHTHRIRTQFPPTLYSTTGKHVRRLLRHRGKRMAHVPCGKLSGHRRRGRTRKDENRMNRQEREEWEILCRQYNVDSLQEAIQGCREELEFLIHCAERLEPRTEEEKTPFNISSPRRFYTPGNAVLGMQETPFLHAETKEQTVF